MHPARLAAVASVFLLVTVLATAPARANITVELREVGGDVVLSGSGKLNFGALTLFASGSAIGGDVDPSAYFLSGAPGSLVNVYSAANFSGPTSFGTGFGRPADSGSGGTFGVNFAFQRVGVAGAATGSSTWTGETLASLGVTPGSYIWTWGSGTTADSIVLLAIGGNCTDGDGDGYGAVGDPDCPGGLAADCNDADPLIHPGAADVCDSVDNNCQDGADEGGVCGPTLVDGTQVTLELEFLPPANLAPVQFSFPLALGSGPDFVQAFAGTQISVDVENEAVDVVVSNVGGGLGNVPVISRLTGLKWTDLTVRIIGASAVSDFDYVYASAPPPFPLPGVAEIIDGGRGVQVYTNELLFQSGEVHTINASFAAGPAISVPALPAPALAAGALVLAGLGVATLRRRATA